MHSCHTGGIVTTLVTAEEVAELQAQAQRLGITVSEVAAPPPVALSPLVAESEDPQAPPAPEKVDALRKGLEDLFNLM
jgi:hypothetical protein